MFCGTAGTGWQVRLQKKITTQPALQYHEFGRCGWTGKENKRNVFFAELVVDERSWQESKPCRWSRTPLRLVLLLTLRPTWIVWVRIRGFTLILPQKQCTTIQLAKPCLHQARSQSTWLYIDFRILQFMVPPHFMAKKRRIDTRIAQQDSLKKQIWTRMFLINSTIAFKIVVMQWIPPPRTKLSIP